MCQPCQTNHTDGDSWIAEKSSSFPFSLWDGARCHSDIEIFLPACLPEKSAFSEAKILKFWLKQWKTNFFHIFSDLSLSFFINIDLYTINISWWKQSQRYAQQAEPAQTGPTLGHLRERHQMVNSNNAYFSLLLVNTLGRLERENLGFTRCVKGPIYT